MTETTNEELLFFNGINGDVGDYDLPPMTGDQLLSFIRGEEKPENLNELRHRHAQKTTATFGLIAGVDAKNLQETGWGVIFAHDADPAVEEALSELLQWRKSQAGERFRIYRGADGFRVDKDTKNTFLARQKVGPGPVDPAKAPYYLLIVGDPAKIPYRFQSQLDVQFAVGRIHFDDLQSYANYARSVVAAERDGLKLARNMTFFGVANPDDKATELSTQHLLEPLYQHYQLAASQWRCQGIFGQEATKTQLTQLLGGEQTPALLFTGSHGMGFNLGSPRQLAHQGALLCQNWPGPTAWKGKGEIPQDFYFAGDDLSASAKLHGLIAFFFACYGAGTPLLDEFAKQAFKERQQIAPRPFLGQLPSRMLSHPNGGALAVIGHVDRAWGYSFIWPKAGKQTEVFQSTFDKLLGGFPVGAALEYFNERYAELSTVLSDQLEDIEFGAQADAYELAGMWTANNDARGYALLGDPAVRLPVVTGNEKGQAHTTIAMSSADDVRKAAQPITNTGVKPSSTVGQADLAAGIQFNTDADAAEQPAGSAPLTPSDQPALTTTTDTAEQPTRAIALSAELKTIVVTTAIDDNKKLEAKTTLTLDGATATLVSPGLTAKDAPLLTLHQALVKEALAARIAYLQSLR
jgi:hypothetical protein